MEYTKSGSGLECWNRQTRTAGSTIETTDRADRSGRSFGPETSESSVGVTVGVAKEETDPAPVFGSVSEADDHSLLAATRSGDEVAFQEIVRRYRNQITNYVYRMIDDYDRAVDIAQETFIRVYVNVDRYQATFSFSTYIYRIAHNLAITELRQRKRRRLIPLPTFFSDKESEEVEVELPDGDQVLADEALIAEERRQAVTTAIASLPEKYRAPLVLCDIEERSYEDISAILGLPTGTVKSRINRARNLLKDKLRELL
ncbi:MAG: sigma-70 family RNA polymerase sigma factor [Acidobacteria bacterium]|nr:sigma-70 family RNA polymerase sigma factor [Acidobacteriota bacterium]